MNYLSIELLSSILQHIDSNGHLIQCTLVNRSFYEATLPILWRFYAVGRGRNYENPKILTAQFIECLQHNHPIGTHARQLELHTEFTDTQLVQLMSMTTPHLNEISIFRGKYNTDLSFQHVPQYWPRLTMLQSFDPKVTQASVDVIGLHCHDLRVLDLYRAPNLGPRTYQILADAGRRLDSITLFGGPYTESWTLDTIMDVARFPLTHFAYIGDMQIIRDILTLTHFCPQLTHLTLETQGGGDWPLNSGDSEIIDERLLIGFIQSHPLLISVNLTNVPGMTNATLDVMARFLPLLKNVNLSQNTLLKCRGVRRFVRDCFHLQDVFLGCGGFYHRDLPEVRDENSSDNNDNNDSHDENEYLWCLKEEDIERIRQIGPQGVDVDLEEDDELDQVYDDDDKAWLRTWKRSYVNLRLYGSGVA